MYGRPSSFRDGDVVFLPLTLLHELFSTPSAHPAAEKMEPRHPPPDALTREVAAAGETYG